MFEGVNQFKYLGTIVNKNNDITTEITNRINMANRCYFGLRKQLKFKFLSKDTKIQLYKALIRPIVLYGSECWIITKAEENKLFIFKRKILR